MKCVWTLVNMINNGYHIVLRKPPSQDHNMCTTFFKSQVIQTYRVLRTIDYINSHYIIGGTYIIRLLAYFDHTFI